MTAHTVSEDNPTYVTRADAYRVSIVSVLTPDDPTFQAREDFIRPEHRRPDGYGLAFLESEEHSLTYIGPVHQIEAYHAITDGSAVLDVSQGVVYAFWPQEKAWDDYIPTNTWNPGGQGIITEFDHPLGGKVTVYEYIETDPDGVATLMVGYHCERCHPSAKSDNHVGFPNRGPQDRRWIARNARVHIRRHAEQCQPIDSRIAEVITAVANDIHNLNNPVTTSESHCATTGPCATIRHLRARA
ncbi:hypothetical protein QMK19_35335 [Streptomyces sp. H10-C2]|uniref:hypothetical protein n=1 Tax=unclassified Streptomyces TaxID=2593676 RepID=UPI0024B93B7E|nr:MULTISPECIES: hypothetical protein [unclassified Streptomyces]MDJ0345909.1 hypothetical protein [Streptomyces sp. PH10-H1]MDJ0374758.1 hypothetical protein [Streptomyces sp. H10-C2]